MASQYETKGWRAEQPGDKTYEGGAAFCNNHCYNLKTLPCWKNKEVKNDFYDVPLCTTCFKEPVLFLLGCGCQWIMACYMRWEILGDNMGTKYACCQEKYGKCWCTPIWRAIPCCPYLGLFLEAFCCPSCAVAGNRYETLGQEPLEERLIETIIQIVAAILMFFSFMGQIIACFMNGCLSGQLEHELAVRRRERCKLLPLTTVLAGELAAKATGKDKEKEKEKEKERDVEKDKAKEDDDKVDDDDDDDDSKE